MSATTKPKLKRSSTLTPRSVSSDLKPRWQPHDYQKKAVRFLLEHGAAALLLDPGLGKTSVVLKAFSALQKSKVGERLLVVAPLRVCQAVWPVETQKWVDFEGLRIVVLHGKDKEKRLKENADIFVINPEGLAWLSTGGRFKMLGVDTLVVDESTKFKHTRTARFKTLKPLLRYFSRRWILTGTPAPNGLLDLFGQIYLLDLGNALGQYITHYRMEYFRPVGFGGFTWVPQPDGEARIIERLKPLALRLEAKDYLHLPNMIENRILVDLPESALKLYKEMEKELIVDIDGGKVTAGNAAAAGTKCRQVANGGLYKGDELLDGVKAKSAALRREWHPLHDAKTDALEDLVEELQGQSLLVAYEFDHDLQRIRARLGKDTPAFADTKNEKQLQELIAKWNRGEIPVLLAQPQSAGHGLNLQENCQHVCWYGITWDLDVYEQFIKRVLRQGNKASHVMVHYLLARGTKDEAILRALGIKGDKQERLLAALKS